MLKNNDYWILEWKPKRNKSTPSPILTAIVTTVRSAKAVITTFCKMFSCQKRNKLILNFFWTTSSHYDIWSPGTMLPQSPNSLGTPTPKSVAEDITGSSPREQFHASVFKMQIKLIWSMRMTDRFMTKELKEGNESNWAWKCSLELHHK